MYRKETISVVMTIAVMLPIIMLSFASAQAQKFVTRQSIVNGLQIQNPQVQRKKRRAPRAVQQQQFQNPQRVVKRRAPSRKQNPQMMRAPRSNGQVVMKRAPARAPVTVRRAPSGNGNVVLRRAPSRAPSGQVAVRRAPPSNQQLRAPKPQNPGVAESRAPKRVAKRRAPARAPQQLRAPNRAPKKVAAKRAPNREPQRFTPQVASNGNQVNDRGIRVEQPQIYDRASVDLEILFDYDSARISPDSVRQLITLGEALQDAALSGSQIMIVGHTDAAGSRQYNSNLSYLRAQSVSNFLSQYAGIVPNRLVIDGYGEDQLKYPDAPNSGQNRRVEIINLGS